MSARGVNTAHHLTGAGVDVTALHLTGAGVDVTAHHHLTGTGVDMTADLQTLNGEVAAGHQNMTNMIRKTVTADVTGIVTVGAVMTAGVITNTVAGRLKRMIVTLLKRGSGN